MHQATRALLATLVERNGSIDMSEDENAARLLETVRRNPEWFEVIPTGRGETTLSLTLDGYHAALKEGVMDVFMEGSEGGSDFSVIFHYEDGWGRAVYIAMSMLFRADRVELKRVGKGRYQAMAR